MFNLASLKWKYRPDNPVRGVTRFKEHPRHIYLDREKVVALKNALDQYHNCECSGRNPGGAHGGT